MKIIKNTIIYLIGLSLLGSIASCSTGSSSGGGISNADGGTEPATYTETDLEGTWRWSANRQTSALNLTGSITFNNNLRVIGMETDRCPGLQNFSTAQFWLFENGYVKGNDQAFCNYPGTEMKFSMDFVPGSNKKTIIGLMDIHQRDLNTGIDSYERYDITMNKQ
ncbi:MAG: hypothetical protein HY787_13330 [Deltaproteobacteria bacterium]|nr:hypothetical protein [Deltaproteobacteria bacterium]